MSLPTDSSGPFLLGVDFGTESCRVAIFDVHGHPVHFAATSYPTHHPRPGWAEQDPGDWWSSFIASTRKAIEGAKINPDQIAGISYDATTMTVVPMDANGNHLRRAIMWMDVRASAEAERASTIDHWARLYNGGGTMSATAEWYPFKVAWLAANEPAIVDQAAYIIDAPDWVTYKLTGEWTININSAAHRMYYNRDHGGWPTEFYDHIGAGAAFSKMSDRVLDAGVLVGTLTPQAANDLGLKAGTPVAQGIADAWAGQIGLGVVRPGKTALITGSSHVISAQSDTALSGKGFFGAYTDGVVPGQYTCEGGQVSTGSVLKWYKDNFLGSVSTAAETIGANPYDLMNQRAAEIPIGSEGLIVNEYFQGNRTPYTDSKARGSIWGLSLHHTPAHIYRAIQEGVCYGTEHILRHMREAGLTVDEIVACGGATKSRHWMQMHADVTGVPITLTEVGDAVVLGSCMIAAVGAGIYSDLQEAADQMVHPVEVIEPDQHNHEAYAFYVDQYANTYPALREFEHAVVDTLG
ncbi:FGGY-family carbohydrate kinase [Stomatohabitans albus]|uniref:FGGY-family carbohydrate kinase n=1 Tax=Stomatohabitans albus TaxID=3110766 RepID=UPI00300CEBE8